MRSAGEYADTSYMTGANIGRFKGAINIDVTNFSSHLKELEKYVSEPIFLYCSHSQRSRRASKMLGESGFKRVYNINGGMSLVNELDETRFPYKNKVIETNAPYSNVASNDVLSLIEREPGLVIIDIRTPSEFASRDSIAENNIGRFKKAINIPQNNFAEVFDSYKMSKDRPLLLYDLHGHNSTDLVDILRQRGFKKIYNLYEGFAAFISDYEISDKEYHDLFDATRPYRLIGPKGTIDLLKTSSDLIILDVRPQQEFQNKSGNAFRNLGKLKGAINVPSKEALQQFMLQNDKNASILVYDGFEDKLGTKTCDELVKNGFLNVKFLSSGLYRYVWSTENMEECRDGKNFLVDHEGLY